MTKQELSLLLYLETRLVDHAGRVNQLNINDDDKAIIERWKNEGYVEFGRIALKDVNSSGALWVRLSDAAWNMAHVERRAIAKRAQEKRGYQTTDEKKKDSR